VKTAFIRPPPARCGLRPAGEGVGDVVDESKFRFFN